MKRQANRTIGGGVSTARDMWGESVAFTTLLFLSSPAYAESTPSTLGSVFCKISTNLVPYGDFIAAVSYVAGIFLICSAAYLLKAHAENPGKPPLTHAFMAALAGAGLISLPEVASIIQHSVVGTISANGSIACTPGATTTVSTGAGSDASKIFQNLFNNINHPLQAAMSTLALVMGAFLVAKGLMKASKYGQDPRAASVAAIMSNLVVGAILLSVGQMVDVLMQTLFGATATSISSFPGLNWATGSGSGSVDMSQANAVVKSILTFVQVIGIIAFLRGWLIIKSAVEGSGQATIAQGTTHILGGVMAINIGQMIVILNKTFGLNVVSG